MHIIYTRDGVAPRYAGFRGNFSGKFMSFPHVGTSRPPVASLSNAISAEWLSELSFLDVRDRSVTFNIGERLREECARSVSTTVPGRIDSWEDHISSLPIEFTF